MKNITAQSLFAGLALLALGACDQNKPATAAADPRPRILVSNPPTAWLVKQIAGDKVIVQTLAHAGGCGHEFQPTDKEMAEAAKAQVWFQVGLEFEGSKWANDLLDRVAENCVPVSQSQLKNGARSNWVTSGDLCNDIYSGKKVPHRWMSFPILKEMNLKIYASLNGLSACYPMDTPNHIALLSSLTDKHARLTTLLLPLKNQAFLADHPAYTYFASDYNLKQIAIEHDGHEPTDADLAQVVAEAKAAGVKVLFLHAEGHRAEAEAIAKAVGAQVILADPNTENTPELLEMMANALVKAHGK